MPNYNSIPFIIRNKSSIFAVFFFALVSILVPLLADAHIGVPDQLVPCGLGARPDCEVCHLYDLAHNLIDLMLWGLATPLLVVALIAGGVIWLTSAGSQQRVELGRRILFSAVIGFLIAFAAWVIVNTILSTLVFKNPFDGRVWSDYSFCKAAPFGGGGGTEPPPDDEPPPLTDPEIEEIVEEIEERIDEGEFAESNVIEEPLEGLEDIVYDPELEEPLLGNPELIPQVEKGALSETEFEKYRTELNNTLGKLGPVATGIKKTNIIFVDKETFDAIYEESLPRSLEQMRKETVTEMVKLGLSKTEAEKRYGATSATEFGITGVTSVNPKVNAVIVCTCRQGSYYGAPSRIEDTIHEVTHAAIYQKFKNANGNVETVGIFNEAKALGGKSFGRPYGGESAAEMLSEAATAHVVSNGTFRPKNAPSGTPAGDNWDGQISWLKKNGIIK